MDHSRRLATDYFIFGQRPGDMALMIDFTNKRLIIRALTSFIEGGVELERIPPGVNGYHPGMVLVKNGWQRQYFLIEREGWTDDDYFILAARLMGQHGITEP